MHKYSSKFWFLAGTLLVVLLLGTLFALAFWESLPSSPSATVPHALFTVIPAPTSTVILPDEFAGLVTPAPQGGIVSLEGISQGIFVQIKGTGGDGLRLRSDPGMDSTPRFLGRESEIFQVRDGPQFANDFIWWYLVTPYDEKRGGWAVSKFLAVVPKP